MGSRIKKVNTIFRSKGDWTTRLAVFLLCMPPRAWANQNHKDNAASPWGTTRTTLCIIFSQFNCSTEIEFKLSWLKVDAGDCGERLVSGGMSKWIRPLKMEFIEFEQMLPSSQWSEKLLCSGKLNYSNTAYNHQLHLNMRENLKGLKPL